MSFGQRLYHLRKEKHLSQEEVAEMLDVTRQTVSKWETDQSTPDFDKIVPLCKLYEITSDELLTGEKKEERKDIEDTQTHEEKRNLEEKKAKGICMGIFTYFLSVIWIMVSIPVFKLDPIIATSIFLFICAIATYLIVYTSMIYRKKKREKKSKVRKQIDDILAIIFTILYFMISFFTMAWHITWILWIVYGLIHEIVKLIFILKEDEDEK